MNRQTNDNNGQSASPDNRGHFLVDINTVLPIFGKRFFLIFYFGRHLHPRQTQMVNRHRAANWLVLVVLLAGLAGLVYGVSQLVSWRLEQGGSPHAGQSTHLIRPGVPQDGAAGPGRIG